MSTVKNKFINVYCDGFENVYLEFKDLSILLTMNEAKFLMECLKISIQDENVG